MKIAWVFVVSFFINTFLYAEEVTVVSEALKMAFPKATSFEKKSIFIKKEVMQDIQKELNLSNYDASRLVGVYIAKNNNLIVGYSYIDTHKVRTLDETVLISIDTMGTIQRIEILAFNESEEYKLSERWLGQFKNFNVKTNIKLNDNIKGVTGASLSSEALILATRKILLIHNHTITK